MSASVTFTASTESEVSIGREEVVTIPGPIATARMISINVDLNNLLLGQSIFAPYVVDTDLQNTSSPIKGNALDSYTVQNFVKDFKTNNIGDHPYLTATDTATDGTPGATLTEQVRQALAALFDAGTGENDLLAEGSAITFLDSTKISAALSNNRDSKVGSHSELHGHQLYTQLFTHTQMSEILDAAGDAGRFVSVGADYMERALVEDGEGVLVPDPGYIHDKFIFKFVESDKLSIIVNVTDADQSTDGPANRDSWQVSLVQTAA